MKIENRNKVIVICYILIIASGIGHIAFILLLLQLFRFNVYWDKKYDFLIKCLAYIFTLGIIIPFLILIHTKKNKKSKFF